MDEARRSILFKQSFLLVRDTVSDLSLETMVLLSTVHESNGRISTTLPPGLVAAFVGATSGIGEYTLKSFAKRSLQPKVYFVGRSQSASERVLAECKAINPQGTFNFIQADVGLIKNVDDACRQIRDQESTINILFMTQGSLNADFGNFSSSYDPHNCYDRLCPCMETNSIDLNPATSEGLKLHTSLLYYSRMRFILNLLPLLEKAQSLRRVVSVFAGGKEGKIFTDNFQARDLSMMAQRDHISSMITLSFEEMSRRAPTVSFIHEFPGLVKTPAVENWPGVMGIIIKFVVYMAGSYVCVGQEESGERHVFLATSAQYPPVSSFAAGAGVPNSEELGPCISSTGDRGSGAYSLNWDGEAGSPESRAALVSHRADGVDKKVMGHMEAELKRITGKSCME